MSPPPKEAIPSSTAARGPNSSAHASNAEPDAASVVAPTVRAAVPPSSGTTQQAAQAAPTPKAAFQGLMSFVRCLGTSPTLES